MKVPHLVVAALLAIVFSSPVSAQQTNEPAKLEVGIQFSSIQLGPQNALFSATVDHNRAEAGFGGRFGYNLNKHFALEAETNYFPHPNPVAFNSGGRLIQSQFGIKAGKRFDKFGFFGKARPGFLSFGQVLTQTGTQVINFGSQQITVPTFEVRRRNFFSMDIGGVLEFYPSRRIVVRFDAGDTIVHTGKPPTLPFNQTPSQKATHHYFQFSSGIAIRFLNPESDPTPVSSNTDRERKWEVGIQFSSLGLREFQFFSPQTGGIQVFGEDINTQAGFGGRATYNVTPNIAAEVQVDFYPADLGGFAFGQAGGRILQVQSGAKLGKRFEKWGLFGKARPGAVSYSRTAIFDGIDPTSIFPFLFHTGRQTYFSMDVGGVLEFYPSRRIVARFDGGDTMIHYGSTLLPFFTFQQTLEQLPSPSKTTHQFQFSAGVGFRF